MAINKKSKYVRPEHHAFYNSGAWKSTRKLFIAKNGAYCERCLKSNSYVMGRILHHKNHITAENCKDIKILTDFNNLEMLCQECHNKEHHKKLKSTRNGSYFNSNGEFIIEKEDNDE